MPQDAAYRKYTEEIINQRAKIVKNVIIYYSYYLLIPDETEILMGNPTKKMTKIKGVSFFSCSHRTHLTSNMEIFRELKREVFEPWYLGHGPKSFIFFFLVYDVPQF